MVNWFGDKKAQDPSNLYYSILRELKQDPFQNLLDVQKKYGLDGATQYFYLRTSGLEKVKAFRRLIEADKSGFSLQNQDLQVVFVTPPDELCQGRNRKAIEHMKNLTIDSGFGYFLSFSPNVSSVLDGALQLKKLIRQITATGQKILLVSTSYGSGFTRFAIDHTPRAELGAVTGWVNLSGLVFGSPKYNCSPRPPMFARKKDLLLRSFSCEQKYFIRPLSGHVPAMVSFLGCSLESEMARHQAKAYRDLRHWGPNDGVLSFREYEKMPGFILPFWQQGHELDFSIIGPVLQRTLCYLADLSRESLPSGWTLADLDFTARPTVAEPSSLSVSPFSGSI